MGLANETLDFFGKCLFVETHYGWGWLVADPTTDTTTSYTTPASFHLQLDWLFAFGGELRGGIGRIQEAGHSFDAYWAVFVLRHFDYVVDFNQKLGSYALLIGKERPRAVRKENWPVEHPCFVFGDTLWYSGFGRVAQSEDAVQNWTQRIISRLEQQRQQEIDNGKYGR